MSDYSAIVDPEYAKYLQAFMPKELAAPRNVGEGLHFIGQSINQAAWRNVYLKEAAKDRAAYNGVVGDYARGMQDMFRPQSQALGTAALGIAAPRPAPETFAAGGTIEPRKDDGAPALRQSPMPLGTGSAWPQREVSYGDIPPMLKQDGDGAGRRDQPPMATPGASPRPPEQQVLGIGAPRPQEQRPLGIAAPRPAAEPQADQPRQAQPVTAVPVAQTDPYAARRMAIQNEAMLTANLLRHPRTMEFGMKKLMALNDQLAQLSDPALALKHRALELDVAGKERALSKPNLDTPEGRATVALQYGLQPGTPEFSRFVLTAQMAAPKEHSQAIEFDKASAKNMAETYQGYIGDGQKAVTASADLERLKELSSMVGTGKLGQWTPTVGPWLSSLGVDVKGLSEAQAFQAIANRMAPAMRPSGSGATSDRDMQIYMSSIPQLSQTPEGRRTIIEQFQSFYDYNKARADIASQVMRKKITIDQGEDAIARLPDPFARFKERMGGAHGPSEPGGALPQGWSIQRVN